LRSNLVARVIRLGILFLHKPVVASGCCRCQFQRGKIALKKREERCLSIYEQSMSKFQAIYYYVLFF
jgi:hypothetical protein